MELFQRIWQENRRFLLLTGSSLALFYLLNSCGVSLLLESARAERRTNQKLEGDTNSLRTRVVGRYPEEEKSLQDLEEIEKTLRGRCLTPAPVDVPDTRRGAAQIQFSERIERIWTAVQSKANQKNVKIPEKISTADLGIDPGHGPEDHARNASYLEVLDRALNACVDHGMVRIDKPSIHAEEALPVRENDDTWAIYRRVTLPVQGPYAAFKRVLKSFQENPRFIQVRVLNLDAKGAEGPAALRGQVEFVGIQLFKEGEAAEPAPDPRAEAKPPRKKKRKR